MGFLDRVVGAATGMTGVERTVGKLLTDIDARAVQGLSEFTVSFSQSDVGTRNRLDLVTPMIIESIQDAGHQVLAADRPDGGWSYVVNLRVRPGTARPSLAARPAHSAEQPEDPALAKLQRSLAASADQPVGNEGHAMTPKHVEETAMWMRQTLETGHPLEVWNHRRSIGYGVAREGVSQGAWFWFNAAPALAALRTGQRDHPFAAMCCGMAENALDTSDPEQEAAVFEIWRLF